MAEITAKEFETLQSGLRELYAFHNLDTLPQTALKLAAKLIPNDLGGYNEVDPERRRLLVAFEPDNDRAERMELIPYWEKYMHQHPVLAHFVEHPSDGPRKISDFLSDDQFRKLDLYTKFYSRIGANYQIAANMPSPKPLVVALAFNRESEDFSERDRKLLSMLLPHLRQAYENAALVSNMEADLERTQGVLDRIDRGIIVVTSDCTVARASLAAIRFSVEWFQGERDADLSRRLPDSLCRWARRQMSALHQSSGQDSKPYPLAISGKDGRLFCRLSCDRQPGQYLLEMRVVRDVTSPETFLDLGLTKRESEVLMWMVNGKSNPEIALSLGISGRTVDKHTQNIFEKLHVDGRTAAVKKGLEWGRW